MIATTEYVLPRHWACALTYGYEGEFDPNEERVFTRFTEYMLETYGKCWCLSVDDDDCGDFRRYHDATSFGGLACDVATYVFDITPEKGA